jgi:ornithine cyclodeaminase/alanine dehydrogenase-like protein (mu-crystallin family)
VVVDTVEGAREETGDLLSAAETGHFDWADAVPLANALDEARRGAGIIVFKSVGHALWNLMAARTAFGPLGSAR